MTEPKQLHQGDACPACGGELRKAPQPTAQQRAKARDRENPIALPRSFDNATEEQIAELGELHRCRDCGYATRFKADTQQHEPQQQHG